MPFTPSRTFPHVSGDPSKIPSLRPAPYLGLDFEWDVRTGVPTTLGVSDGKAAVSGSFVQMQDRVKTLLRANPQAELVGHNLIGAELPIMRRQNFPPVDLARVKDTILLHWLCNLHLCKGSAGKNGDEDADPKGRGFMNLWTMLSLYTDAWCYKDCRGAGCHGPCPEHQPRQYNGLDAFLPVQAVPAILWQIRIRNLEAQYNLHVQLADYLTGVREAGVPVDMKYVTKLSGDFDRAKARIWNQISSKFNPRSPSQVLRYFKAQGVSLKDATEATVREAFEETGNADLGLLLDWKELGNGADRWFKPRTWNEEKHKWDGFVDENGLLHPRLGFFTSEGRLQCTGPNLQNVSKRRKDRNTGESIGKRVRKAIVAPEGCYILRADYKGAEFISCLWQAGVPGPWPKEVHKQAAADMNLDPKSEFVLTIGGGSVKEAAKTIVHAQSYAEGLELLKPEELSKPIILKEVAAGARWILPEWKFNGKIVTFTGKNFAERVWGDGKSFENRKKALDFAKRYFSTPAGKRHRALQMQICREIERNLSLRTPSGLYVLSYGRDEERMKTALAVMGAEPIAFLTKIAMLRAKDDGRFPVMLQVHDELLFAVPHRIPPAKAYRHVREYMETPTDWLPGLQVLTDGSYGMNWAEQQPLQ